MAAKLSSARFRHLNEQLYTRPSSASRALFEASPDLFAAYHTGFRQQVAVWPSNPVDGFIADVRRRARNASLPHRSSVVGGGGSNSRRLCMLADLGCGDAGLARTLVGANNKNSGGGGDDDGDIEAAVSGMTVRLHSFDLHAANHFVTAADVSALPLPAGSVDVAVLCLALMGTNWPAFVDEAWRVLRERGELWVAEIKSRFGRSTTTTTAATSSAVGKIGTLKENGNNTSHRKMNGKSGSGGSTTKADRETTQAEHDAILAIEVDGLTPSVAAPGQPPHADSTDVSAFVALLRAHGFDLAGSERESVDRANKMFVKMRFVKAAGRLPARGKNAGPATVLEGTGGFGDRFGRVKKKKRFLDNVDDDIVPQEEEAKILKPCVYKLR
jgi:ribosomal RNA-processing protein 8